MHARSLRATAIADRAATDNAVADGAAADNSATDNAAADGATADDNATADDLRVQFWQRQQLSCARVDRKCLERRQRRLQGQPRLGAGALHILVFTRNLFPLPLPACALWL